MTSPVEFHDLSELALNSDGQSWGNLGYWQDENEDYSQACKTLALRLGQAAQLNQKSIVFDAGFGCGDQLLLWLDHFQVADTCGVNLSQSQTQSAQRLLTDNKKSDQVKSIIVGDVGEEAVWLKAIENRKISHILALDCAYHFSNRIRFFQVAKTHLASKGAVALTDFMLADQNRRQSLKHWVLRIMLKLSRISSANIINETEYKSKLEACGFSDVIIEDISKLVMLGFASWYGSVRTNLHANLALKARLKYRITATFLSWAYRHEVLRYCLITARKRGDRS